MINGSNTPIGALVTPGKSAQDPVPVLLFFPTWNLDSNADRLLRSTTGPRPTFHPHPYFSPPNGILFLATGPQLRLRSRFAAQERRKTQQQRRIPVSDINVIPQFPYPRAAFCDPPSLQPFPATSRNRDIFTPGPTPSLLIATNVTFAALQALLFALLLATYSIHFFVLSILSGALWWSINWFAQELRQVQAQEAEKEKQSEEEPAESQAKSDGSRKTPATLDSAGSDTETELLTEHKGAAATASAPRSLAASATLRPPEEQGEIRKRLSVSGESSGYQSTDSEWEKVDDGKAA
ncbi:hypothetical protein CBS147346_1405 [Aspergillus niger]|nr:hypothetical protein CBS147346_1405 [Aspergillus niger]